MATDSRDLGLLIERVLRLERQNRRLKAGGAAALVAVGALLLMGQAAPGGKVLQAERFVVVDSAGKERAVLGMQSGFPYLALRDEKGSPRASISLSRRGEASLELFDSKATARAVLEVARGENPGLFFFQNSGAPQLLISADRSDEFSCRFFGSNGKITFEAPGAEKR